MTIVEFITAYQALKELETVNCPLPAVKNPSNIDTVLTFCKRGDIARGIGLEWQNVTDFMFQNLCAYWVQNWKSMIGEYRDHNIEQMLALIARDGRIMMFMGKEFWAMVNFVSEKNEYDLDIEKILHSKTAEAVLLSQNFIPEVREGFKKLMLYKIEKAFDTFFSINYTIFLDWFPKTAEFYPEVLEALQKKLEDMKEQNQINLRCWEVRKLYNFYMPEEKQVH